jgi:hypothetical protein
MNISKATKLCEKRCLSMEIIDGIKYSLKHWDDYDFLWQ